MHAPHPETEEFVSRLMRWADSQAGSRTRQRALSRLTASLLRPLAIGIFGEAGAGKSTLLNALLGQAVLPPGGFSGVRPFVRAKYGEQDSVYSIRTDGSRHRLSSKAFQQAMAGNSAFANASPKVIYRAREPAYSISNSMSTTGAIDFIEVRSPIPLLRSMEPIEFPASYTPFALRSALLRKLTRIDIALWVTPAWQAWKRSEFQKWQLWRPAPKELSLIIATHKEGLSGLNDQVRLMARLRKECNPYFADGFLISAKQALDVRAQASEAPWPALLQTGLPELESALGQLVSIVRQARLVRATTIFQRIKDNNYLTHGESLAKESQAEPAPA
jgi:Dynamin family